MAFGDPEAVRVTGEVHLSADESHLFSTLRDVVSHYGLGTQLRVAGGWVRDKVRGVQSRRTYSALSAGGGGRLGARQVWTGARLWVAGGWVRDKLIGRDCMDIDIALDNLLGRGLADKLIGRDCIDIDIALDNLLGREFAEKVTEYLKERGEVVRGVGVIQKNPDQSKHLETATMMIYGMWIDFVNLRAEEYAHDSRIPHSIEFGTAEEDALRRDLTINSMFYNISTEQVEDPTGRGISDLNGGVIRTPLPPHQTFLDDPLRVLRAVRFAARFGFSLDEELRAAAASEEVRTALGNKVSKERIGKEVELMLKSRDPYAAISLVVDLNLFPTVFPLPHAPSHTADVPPDDELPGLCEASFAATCTRLHQWEKHLPQALIDHLSDLSVGLLLAALLMPLRHAHYLDKKKKEVPFAQHIVLDSLKLKRAYADMVVLLHAAAEDFTALAPLLTTPAAEAAPGGGEDAATAAAGTGGAAAARCLTLITPPHEEFQDNARVLAGKLLRKVKACWPSAVLLASTLPPVSSAARSEQCGLDSVTLYLSRALSLPGLLLLGRPKALAAMLAIFQKSIGEAPQELMAPKLNRSASMSGRLDAKEILHGFKKAHPGAVLMQFDDQHAIAYTHDMQDFLMPRQFAACDDVFCAFAGNIENLAQLRQRYGLDRHVSEVNLIIEAYKTLRDRRPYPPDQVIADLAGAFAFVLYDNKAKTVFVAHDAQGKVPLYWGKCLDDGVLAFSDDPAVLKAGTGSSFAPFPLGCFYSSDGGLRSFTDPEKQLKAIQHIDSQGELCGATFKVDSQQDLTQMPLDSKDDSGRGWS
ncbi:unnamed protein product [Closterium sp. Naga37s-1]|nr:unnamed protein product [Closterium sp. Naga37s-1]